MIVLSEFLDDNSHKLYPFANHNDIPTSLIVDARFLVTENIVDLYISSVQITESHVFIDLAATLVDSRDVALGNLLVCEIPTERNVSHACKIIDDELAVIVDGTITFGDFSQINGIAQSYVLDSQTGLIFSNCVFPMTEWCSGFMVNGKIYTGLVTITATDGISLNVEEQKNEQGQVSGCEIVLRATGFQPDQSPIPEKFEERKNYIIESVLKTLGTPVTSINCVTPDENGTIVFQVTPDTETGNIVFQSSSENIVIANAGSNVITISQPEASLCADNKEIENIYMDISTLNERAGALTEIVRAIDNNVNILSAQLIKVD